MTLYVIESTSNSIGSSANDDTGTPLRTMVTRLINDFTAINSAVAFDDAGGIYLGGSISANLLDDYEEGTWTPVISDASTGGNIASVTVSEEKYTKIGNLARVSVKLINIDTSGMTGGNSIFIQGLPFVADDSSVGFCLTDTVSYGAASPPTAYVLAGASYLNLRQDKDNTNFIFSIVSQLTSGGSDLQINITYRV